MASQSLYRKWRSQTFGDLVGQEPVVRTLKNALTSGKLGHAYLFTGPRGTGKTSTARLLAKTINCLNPQNGEPCNECQQCKEITGGNSFNVIEIDAASNRGIDSIRELREKVMMPPATGKYKVYVLDEAHMLTTEAFNALLKTLEEPPDYAIFVMATTDVHKMLPTVLSRCQRFDFKRITTREIVAHLEFVAKEEHVKLERGAAELIARAASGGMRDALSLLDQAIAYAGAEIALEQVQLMLGVADPRAIQKLILHVAEANSAAGLHLIHELADAGADLRQINSQLVEYWRSLMLAKAGADVGTILDRTEDEVREVLQTVRLFELEELTELARVFAQNDLMQKNQGTPQLGLELAFLSCVEIHRRAQSGQPLVTSSSNIAGSAPAHATIANTQPQRAMVEPSLPRHQAIASSQPPVDIRPAAPLKGNQESEDTLTGNPSISASDESDERNSVQAPQTKSLPTKPREVEAPDLALPPPLEIQQLKDAWENIKKRVKGKNREKGPKTAAMLSDFSVMGIEGTSEEVQVIIQAAHELHYNYLNDDERVKDVEWAIAIEFSLKKCRLRLLSPGQTLSNTQLRIVNNRSANTVAAVPPQQSARREPVVSPPPSIEPAKQVEPVHSPPPELNSRSSDTQFSNENSTSPSFESNATPLARMNNVRENTNIASQETIKQKASSDPIVQEVIKTFSARIVDIRPK